MRKLTLWAVVVTSAVALADPQDVPLTPPRRTLATNLKENPQLPSRIGIVVDVGGGATQFFGNAAMDAVKPGPSWTARLELGSRLHVGGELAYVGSAQSITALGVDPKALLLSNGFEGLLRWNVLTGAVQPYAAVGLGYKHFSVRNTAVNTSDLESDQNVADVPMGLGMAFRTRGLVVDGRFAISAPIDATMIPSSRATSWDIGAKVGYEF